MILTPICQICVVIIGEKCIVLYVELILAVIVLTVQQIISSNDFFFFFTILCSKNALQKWECLYVLFLGKPIAKNSIILHPWSSTFRAFPFVNFSELRSSWSDYNFNLNNFFLKLCPNEWTTIQLQKGWGLRFFLKKYSDHQFNEVL